MLRRIAIQLAGLLLMVWSLGPRSAGAQEDEPYYMADVQATVNLPPNWKMTRWSDWDFKAESKRRGVIMWLSKTPYQVSPDDESAAAWAKMHAEQLEDEKAGDIKATRIDITEFGGHPTAEIDMTFRFNGNGPAGVFRAMAVPAAGKVIHVSTLAAARNTRFAEEDLRFIVENLEIAVPAAPLDDLFGHAESSAGFSADLPPGWRLPTDAEFTSVKGLVDKTGQAKFDPDQCWVAIRPLALLEPDLMVFCRMGWYMNPVDEHSWAGEEEGVRSRFFGKTPVDASEEVSVADRKGFLYAPDTPVHALRMSVIPYDQGVLVGWGLAEKSREDALDVAFRATLASTHFSGPDGGKPRIGLAQWMAYAWQYRKTDPLFFGPALLFMVLFGVGIVKLARKKPPVYDDLD